MMSQTSALRARGVGHPREPKGRGGAWTEEREARNERPSDEGRRRLPKRPGGEREDREGSMRSHWLRIAAACCAIGLGVTACGSDASGNSSGSGTAISIWEGWTGAEAKAFARLASEYQKQNPGTTVNSLFVNNDNTLQKVLTAVRGGSPPDIAYLYGSWAPNVAQIPQVVNLGQVVQRPGVNWSDFWVGERDVATVNGKVIGIPALVDNLAVVYNKTLFAQAHLALPGPDWTWQQFVADAQKLTNPSIKQYG